MSHAPLTDDWRENVRIREQDDEINCKRCKHYLEDGDDAPVCLAWSKTRGRMERIGLGWSGVHNDAPFCNLRDFSKRDVG